MIDQGRRNRSEQHQFESIHDYFETTFDLKRAARRMEGLFGGGPIEVSRTVARGVGGKEAELIRFGEAGVIREQQGSEVKQGRKK